MDPRTLKKGDKIYRVEWVDRPDEVEDYPTVVEFEVIGVGSDIVSIRRQKTHRNIRTQFKRVVFPYAETKEGAIKLASADAKHSISCAEYDIKVAKAHLASLAKLEEALEAQS